MRKTMVVIFVLFLIVSCVVAESSLAIDDPVVGGWYMFTDITDSSDYEMMIWIFKNDGTAKASYLFFQKDGNLTFQNFDNGSTWRRDEYDYFLKDGPSDEQKMFVEGDSVWVWMSGAYMRLQRLDVFDFSTDVQIRK